MDYDIALRLENMKVKSNKQYHCKPSRRYIKIQDTWLLNPGLHTFLHRRNTSGVKIKPTLKNHIYFMN